MYFSRPFSSSIPKQNKDDHTVYIECNLYIFIFHFRNVSFVLSFLLLLLLLLLLLFLLLLFLPILPVGHFF